MGKKRRGKWGERGGVSGRREVRRGVSGEGGGIGMECERDIYYVDRETVKEDTSESEGVNDGE